MHHSRSLLTFVVLLGTFTVTVQSYGSEAEQVLDASGVAGGFISHVGCGDGSLTTALGKTPRFQVHGIDQDAENVKAARAAVQSAGLYGDVSIDQFNGQHLPYIDNLLNLVVSTDIGDVSMDEVMRVLAPNGVAYIRRGDTWEKRVKPRPKSIDDWTHFLHSPGGNAVAHDTEVGPPRHLQWLGSPRWSRHHDRMASMSALVSCAGRIYYIMDEGSRVSIQLPPKWKLIARDAFNGTVLWKVPLTGWQNHLWPLKSGPTQLARRLVATKDTVYVTLGLEAPLTAIDAVTGETLRTYEGTRSTEEVLSVGNQLFVLCNEDLHELHDYSPKFNVGDQRRVFTEFQWNKKPRKVMSVNAASGEIEWFHESLVAPLTLSADSDRVFFHDGQKVVCLDQQSGREVWTSKPADRRSTNPFNFGPKLLVTEGVVLFAGGTRSMTAFEAKSGKELWTGMHARGGYQSPEDLLVIDGLVWSAPTTSGGDSGVFTGRDLRTGEVKVEFPPNVDTYWFHHRCYIAKATDNFILPSRTGVEFVDFRKKDWEIHHWVRGGCLYGVMPANGLLYAPPHNCFCYPEAKLFGMNALAPVTPTRARPQKINEADRLERGAAYDFAVASQGAPAADNDWPTYRQNTARSGSTATKLPAALFQQWETKLSGRLSSVTVAAGKLFVAQVDQHTLHALDAATGAKVWSYMTGARIDSPPTYYHGTVLFGSADGHVYCLRASDGELAWRYRAAPIDRRMMALEQLESVWPVHGNVLVHNDVAYFVAGRSNYLDGGLRLFRMDPRTGKKISESIIDDRDPETGKNLQERLQILNMPAGLSDILSCDGKYVYMRSQQFDLEGNRLSLGPHSGDPAAQGSVQKGEAAHLFSPNGFLDDSWFHRAYWVYGRSYAGGHSGYHQAGKYAPAGRLLVFDDKNVYGFGRKSQYLRWTTTIEHQLFSADRFNASSAARTELTPLAGRRGAVKGSSGSAVRFPITKSLDPTGKPIAVEAWVKAEKPNGVVIARGGPAQGFALTLKGGKPTFMIRAGDKLSSVSAAKSVVGRWAHLFGMVTADKKLHIYVDGRLMGDGKADSLITSDPKQAMEIGLDDGGAVGDYQSPHGLTGLIDEVNVYYGSVTAEEVGARLSDPNNAKVANADLVVRCSFDSGRPVDQSTHKNNGQMSGVRIVEGRYGKAFAFTGNAKRGRPASGSTVEKKWVLDIPLFPRAMLKAGDLIFTCGPPDIMDEEETFSRIVNRDPAVNIVLAEQDAALLGSRGAVLHAVSAKDGVLAASSELPSLPIWDSMATAGGRLYMATEAGTIVCLGGE